MVLGAKVNIKKHPRFILGTHVHMLIYYLDMWLLICRFLINNPMIAVCTKFGSWYKGNDSLLGESMKMGVYFGGSYEKINLFFSCFSTLGEQRWYFCLELHFQVKTKILENYVSFLFIIFWIFFIEIWYVVSENVWQCVLIK